MRSDAALFGVVIVWPFVADTTFTLLRRTFRGEQVLVAHRTHIYQRMTQIGLSHSAVALVYMAMAAIGACEAAGMIPALSILSGGGLPLLALLAVIVWAYVAVHERRYVS